VLVTHPYRLIRVPIATQYLLIDATTVVEFAILPPLVESKRVWDCMKRREFIGVVGAAATWQFAARGQQPAKIPRIGSFSPGSSSAYADVIEALRAGLAWISRRTDLPNGRAT
jgi:hypothetical protein